MNLSVVISTNKEESYIKKYKESIIKSIGLRIDKDFELLIYNNNNEFSLSELYNRALNETKSEIVIFMHDDLEFDTPNWGRKFLKYVDNNPEYGIIGLAGTKYLSETGRWWDVPTTMYGIVNHKKDGKKWTSNYSLAKTNKIDDVVLVDGLFFLVNKKNIKFNFDERFEGFHFYDLGFCVPNYLEGVKIGVTTDIRFTHLSIGETNDKWEDNRVLFSSIYSKNLPLNIKRRDKESLNILISCLNFCNYTGSELYVYELSRALVKLGHNVTVFSNTKGGGDLHIKAKSFGVNVIDFTENIKGNYDILHLNHKPIAEQILKIFPTVPAVMNIHSEVIGNNLEDPIIFPTIKKYIAIREEIKTHLISKFNIDTDKIEVVYNPIDENRFNTNGIIKTEKESILFVGTIDYLRYKTILDLIQYSKNNNKELVVVGKENGYTIRELLPENPHVKYYNATWKVEDFVKNSTETASILMGRTTIEGWMCGKNGWIYNIDNKGNIIDKKLVEPPLDIDKFKSENVAKLIIEEYYKAI